ncbi:MAG: uracil-DNA glycosylase [Actinobacteria bacterium]|nr:uracil-DNA glycosylase [Actinomycetota bacterium]
MRGLRGLLSAVRQSSDRDAFVHRQAGRCPDRADHELLPGRRGRRSAGCPPRRVSRGGRGAPILLVGEPPGYRGARVSGIPFTSERQLTGAGPAEATATIVRRTLGELGLLDRVLLWNVVPTHPGTETTNRPPARAEVVAGRLFAEELARGRQVIAVGRIAAAALGSPAVRHPSRGGAVAFAAGLRELTSS